VDAASVMWVIDNSSNDELYCECVVSIQDTNLADEGANDSIRQWNVDAKQGNKMPSGNSITILKEFNSQIPLY